MSDGGKGSTQRPIEISHDEMQARWDAIFGKKKDEDPCPGCRPNVRCRTPNCGRLKQDQEKKAQ